MSTAIPPKIQARTQSGKSFYIEVEAQSGPAPAQAPDSAGAEPDGDDEEVTRGDGGLFHGGQAQGSRVLRTDLFVKAVDVLREISEDVTTGLLDSNPRPSKVQLGLDLGFDAGGNVWILKGGARATMRLTLEWAMPGDD